MTADSYVSFDIMSKYMGEAHAHVFFESTVRGAKGLADMWDQLVGTEPNPFSVGSVDEVNCTILVKDWETDVYGL